MAESSNPSKIIKMLLLAALAVAAFWWGMPKVDQSKRDKKAFEQLPDGGIGLSALGQAPDWSELEAYQRSITRSDFEHLLSTVFCARNGWKHWIAIDEDKATIVTHRDTYEIQFAPINRSLPEARYWRFAHELGPAPVGRPLHGLHVALDPGHLGGRWAKMEARWLSVDGKPPICEGDMTLFVAELMMQRLESLGAHVSLVRRDTEPLTDLRPEDLMDQAREAHPDDEAAAMRLAERWFYRTAEIQARALKVNQDIKPDLVLALHFNAEFWGDPSAPQLMDHSHVHMLVHGGYGDDELALEDQRQAMLLKLLSRGHPEEVGIAKSIMDVFTEVTGLPAFQYPEQNRYVCDVAESDGVWARNLLANRLYDCPVVYLEPYLMNSKRDYPRMLAGDYVGLREVDGRQQISIFREYAESAVAGLVRFYGSQR